MSAEGRAADLLKIIKHVSEPSGVEILIGTVTEIYPFSIKLSDRITVKEPMLLMSPFCLNFRQGGSSTNTWPGLSKKDKVLVLKIPDETSGNKYIALWSLSYWEGISR